MRDEKKVLIVEDEVIVSEDLKGILEKIGYSVIGQATTGLQAVEMAKRHLPHAILMDIFLKGDMDGIQAAHVIRESTGIFVIYISAFSDENLLERAKVTEPYGYIVKPFQERQVASCIKMALYKNEVEQKIQRYSHDLESAKVAYERLADELARTVESMKHIQRTGNADKGK